MSWEDEFILRIASYLRSQTKNNMFKTSMHILSIAFLAMSLSACDGGSAESTPAEAASAENKEVKAVNTGSMKFAYVNTDSLSMKFDMINDFEEEIVQERLEMENRLQGMVRSLEKDYTDAQAGAAGLSQEALNILQQKLAQKEQQVMQQKSAMEERLMRSEQEKTDRYLERVQDFLDAYGKSQGYDVIYGFNGLNNVLYIDEAYDITDAVIDSLNSAYQNEKAQTELQAQK